MSIKPNKVIDLLSDSRERGRRKRTRAMGGRAKSGAEKAREGPYEKRAARRGGFQWGLSDLPSYGIFAPKGHSREQREHRDVGAATFSAEIPVEFSRIRLKSREHRWKSPDFGRKNGKNRVILFPRGRRWAFGNKGEKKRPPRGGRIPCYFLIFTFAAEEYAPYTVFLPTFL